MTDVHTKEIRSKNMSQVKGKNTSIELLIRSLLHRNGFRFSLHNKSLPGKPDLYLKKYNTVVFIHGCFWHMHGCRKTNIPKNNSEFWKEKLQKNRFRDKKNIQENLYNGKKVVLVWECSLKGKKKLSTHDILEEFSKFLISQKNYLEISG